MGAKLTIIYSSETVAPRPKPRPGAIMPLLVILFIVSYGILTMLVFEQGQTIESQRGLIREMLKDSTQLSAIKDKMGKDDVKRLHEKAPVQASPEPDSKGTDAASSAAGPKTSDKKDNRSKSARTMKQVPGKPASDLEDVRRATRVI
jgi:hypothetical protein